ncbi:glutathione binding-like protein [soil metagenome]
MQLYFSPFACSLASRIALIEAGGGADYALVGRDKTLPGGGDFRQINSLGYVPALDIGEDEVLTEGSAILQFIADSKPDSGLAPAWGSPERYRLQQWLSFVATEIHAKIFANIFDPGMPEDAKTHVREKAKGRFERLSHHLENRDFLLDQFSVADAYLVTVLNWMEYGGFDIKAWPILDAYRTGLRGRPSVAQAMAEERPLMQAA